DAGFTGGRVSWGSRSWAPRVDTGYALGGALYAALESGTQKKNQEGLISLQSDRNPNIHIDTLYIIFRDRRVVVNIVKDREGRDFASVSEVLGGGSAGAPTSAP